MTCSVTACERDRTHGSYCEAHHQRVRRNGHPGDTPIRSGRGTCSVDGCGKQHYAKSFCSCHYSRWKRHGDPHHVGIPGWRGEDAAYMTVHNRLYAKRGPASQHSCESCGDPAAEWAYDHQDPEEKWSSGGYPYSVNLSRYLPLCKPCHTRLDSPVQRSSRQPA